MSNSTEDVKIKTGHITSGDAPDVLATNEVFYFIKKEIVLKEENEEIALNYYELQEGIVDPLEDHALKYIKAEKEEELEVKEHIVEEEVQFEDLITRLIKHEEDEMPLENVVADPQVEDKSVAAAQTEDRPRGGIFKLDNYSPNASRMPERCSPVTAVKAGTSEEIADTSVLNTPDNTHTDTVIYTREYVCRDCPFICKSTTALSRHISQKHVLKQCSLCPYVSRVALNFSRHEKVHKRAGPFKCSLCSHQCASFLDFEKHLAVHAKNKCPHCPLVFITNPSLKKHIRDTHLVVQSRRCPLSPFGRYRSTELKKRINQTDPEKELFQCPRCPCTFQYAYALKYHMTTCENGAEKQLKFKCRKCPYVAGRTSHLRLHMAMHPGVKKKVKYMKCSQCSFTCERATDLRKHSNYHLRLHMAVQPEVKVKYMKCSQCSFTCERATDLRKHSNNHLRLHMAVQPEVKVKVKYMKCSQCSFTCERATDLRKHSNKIHKNV